MPSLLLFFIQGLASIKLSDYQLHPAYSVGPAYNPISTVRFVKGNVGIYKLLNMKVFTAAFPRKNWNHTPTS